MTSELLSDQSVLLGSQSPRLRFVPEYDKTLGDAAVALVARAGLVADKWQRDAICDLLAVRDNGKWTAPSGAFVCPRQNGKDLAASTPILATSGWKTMGTVAVGDFVYGPDGQPTRVLAVSETFTNHRCYEVEFTDGAVIVAGEDHLWSVWDKGAHNATVYAATEGDTAAKRRASKGAWLVLSTKDIANSRWGWRRANGRMEYQYRVRCDAIIDSPEANLPIDPYVFGYWLGDGTSAGSILTVGSDDLGSILAEIESAGLRVVSSTKELRKAECWRVRFNTQDGKRGGNTGTNPALRLLGVLNNKHIPECYLTASVDQRKALLAGLLDSDGTITNHENKSPRVEFSVTSKQLAHDFLRLVRSLGIRTSVNENDAKLYGRRISSRYRVAWTPTFNPFRLPRKAARYTEPYSRQQELMSIVGVREVPTVSTRCIQVDNPEHVYLVGEHFTPTHNSLLLAIREMAGLFLLDERLIVHSSHEQATASEQFRLVLELIEETPEFKKRMLKPIHGKGSEAIELRNGQRILFKTRTSGGLRGFTVDCLVFDEAYNLPNDAIAAMLPTTTAATNPQVLYASSAVDKQVHEHGVNLARIRRHAPESPSIAYLEWSAEGDDPERVSAEYASDHNVWAMANPGLGVRQDIETLANIHSTMGPRQWAVEHLGIGDWPSDDPDADRVITVQAWQALLDEGSKMANSDGVIAFDVAPDLSMASIAGAGLTVDGKVHIGIIDRDVRFTWVAARINELYRTLKPSLIIADTGTQAMAVLPELERLGVPVRLTNTKEYAQACSLFAEAVQNKTISHVGDPSLLVAVDGADTKPLSDSFKWDRRKSSAADISPLVAATLAHWGVVTQSHGEMVWDLTEIAARLMAEDAAKVNDQPPDSDLSSPITVQPPTPEPGKVVFIPLSQMPSRR